MCLGLQSYSPILSSLASALGVTNMFGVPMTSCSEPLSNEPSASQVLARAK